MRGLENTDTVGMEPQGGTLETFAFGLVVGDRYEILRPLGTGGSAIVYAAHDRTLKRDIALKVLRADKATGSALTRFRREVRVARDVQSPHLVPIYDIGESESTAWISMELLEGGSLRTLIGDSPPPVERVIEIAEQLLEALDALHSHGIVHRDVKPANVMIDAAGHIKLTDMGLARRWDSLETRATATDHLVGTLEYLSPEQALGLDLDGRSDLYSLGTLLYELLTGRLPFEALSSLGTVVAHVHAAPPDVRKLRKDVPTWLAILIARLLAKRREERYQTAGEVLRDLRARRTDWRFALRRSRTRIAVGAALLMLLVAGTLVWKTWNDSRFDKLVSRGPTTTAAIDRSGRDLWVKTSYLRDAMVIAQLSRWEPARVVAGAVESTNAVADNEHHLEILDAQTGELMHRVSMPEVGIAYERFANRFSLIQIMAVDLDHDGLDEIVASFAHTPYYPSYAVFYDPAEDYARLVFRASGHARVTGTADFDGDGVDELVFFGINNRLGAYNAVAVVQAKGFGEKKLSDYSGEWPPVASSPDMEFGPQRMEPLYSYAILPSPLRQAGAVEIDPERRVLHVTSPNDHVVTLDFDGFPIDAPSLLPPDERREVRRSAYQAARSGIRRREAGLLDDAQVDLAEAFRLATEVNDAMLVEWIRRNQVRLHIRTRQFDAAEGLLESLIDSATNPADAVWDAAFEYHLGGSPERAAELFAFGLNMNQVFDRGRKKYEYVEGALLALSELRDWSEAERLVRQYQATFPETVSYFGRHYRTFIEWRSTGRISSFPDDRNQSPDLQRYWRLEWTALEAIDAPLLERVDEELGRTTEGRSLLRALRAHVLHQLGQTDEARIEIRQAWNEASVARDTDPVVRGHFDIVRERYERITGEEAPSP